MATLAERTTWIQAFTQDRAVADELLRYTAPRFDTAIYQPPVRFPLPDEPYLTTWAYYAEMAREAGVFETLRRHIVQLQFPIAAGIGETAAYRAATTQGVAVGHLHDAGGLVLDQPASLRLSIHASLGGGIPVLIAPHEADFRRLVQAFAYRNEPVDLPPAMGAAMIKGINNWDRIRRMQQQWTARYPADKWPEHLRTQILPNRSLYQDKLIILSQKPYSGVPAAALGLAPSVWERYSLRIRMEHECAHFFTLRYFGTMANNMHDELIADYMGIVGVAGTFRADWFLHFIGLEDYPRYRPGARLENYLGKPALSPQAFVVLQHLMVAAADAVARFDEALGKAPSDSDLACRLLALCACTLEEMAVAGPAALRAAYERSLAALADERYPTS